MSLRLFTVGVTSAVWRAPTATGPLHASVRVPGSKSATNRALVLAALSTGPTLVRSPLVARDTRLMLEALEVLGCGVEAEGADVVVRPGRASGPPTAVYVGSAGTVARFTPAVAALGERTVTFDGDEQIRRRPVRPLLDALRVLGVDVDDGGRGALPFTVSGHGRVDGGEVGVDASGSSQFLSALLLAGPAFERGVTVRALGGPPPSGAHLAMTVDALTQFGATVERRGDGYRVEPGPLSCPDLTVEPDLSTAAPFAAAAVVAGGRVHVGGWPSRSHQPGDRMRELLTTMGGSCSWGPAGLTVVGDGTVRALDVDLRDQGELTPVVAALMCFGDGPSRIRGVAHLRGHESDRLAALAAELSRLGAGVEETEDGLVVVPGPMHGGRFRTYDDHRLVMAAALVALRVPGVEVEDPGTVGKTFPGFVEAWETALLGPTP